MLQTNVRALRNLLSIATVQQLRHWMKNWISTLSRTSDHKSLVWICYTTQDLGFKDFTFLTLSNLRKVCFSSHRRTMLMQIPMHLVFICTQGFFHFHPRLRFQGIIFSPVCCLRVTECVSFFLEIDLFWFFFATHSLEYPYYVDMTTFHSLAVSEIFQWKLIIRLKQSIKRTLTISDDWWWNQVGITSLTIKKKKSPPSILTWLN